MKSPVYVAGIGARRPADRLLVDGDDLVDLVRPGHPGVGPGLVAGLVERVDEALVQDVVDERALPRAGDAGHGRHDGQRKTDVHPLEIVLARLVHGQPARRAPPRRGHGNALFAAQILGREGVRGRHDPGERALGDLEAAALPRSGAEVQDVVGGPDRLLVVLDDDDGVPGVPQALEHGDEPAVVPLVEADGRLVEDIEDPSQSGADLGGEPDALGLPPREGDRRPAQLEVGHPQPVHDLEAIADLPDDLVGDLLPGGGKAKAAASSLSRPMGRSASSMMFRPWTRTIRLSFLSRAPAAGRTDVVGQLDLPPFVLPWSGIPGRGIRDRPRRGC